jgi:hypothetical protein
VVADRPHVEAPQLEDQERLRRPPADAANRVRVAARSGAAGESRRDLLVGLRVRPRGESTTAPPSTFAARSRSERTLAADRPTARSVASGQRELRLGSDVAVHRSHQPPVDRAAAPASCC